MIVLIESKTCSRCFINKPLTEFYPQKLAHRGYCKTCTKELTLKTQLRHQTVLGFVKTTAGCADCGYNTHFAALDFDHLPGTEKKFKLCSTSCRSWASIWEEVMKCEVVCSNCHRVRTMDRKRESK